MNGLQEQAYQLGRQLAFEKAATSRLMEKGMTGLGAGAVKAKELVALARKFRKLGTGLLKQAVLSEQAFKEFERRGREVLRRPKIRYPHYQPTYLEMVNPGIPREHRPLVNIRDFLPEHAPFEYPGPKPHF